MLETLAGWLHSDAIVAFMNLSAWIWPTFEVIHYIGFALLFGTILLLDLRLLGVAKGLPVAALQRLVPWGIFGFSLNVITGVLWVMGIASNGFSTLWALQNLAVQFKLVCIFLAGVNLAFFYVSGMARRADEVGPGEDAPIGAKLVAASSLVLWIAVLYFGRMIMYADDLSLALGL